MANWKAKLASGSEYDVFLNFRGEDTRHNFTDFLYDRLVDAGVRAFRDEEKLPHGDVIGHELEHAINNSVLYIPIFSPNYASSKWCLRELKLIVDNVSASGGKKSILPIFLFVEPDDVKLKARPRRDPLYKVFFFGKDPLYKVAFQKHKKDHPKEVDAWKAALGKVDEHKGWVVEKKTSQAAIVKLVVQRVLEKLKIKQKLVTEHLVGVDDRVKDLMGLLNVNHPDVRLIVIYGMGGIGKTTVAKEVFNQLSSHFGKRCSFLEDVRKSSSTKEGIVQLQKQLLSDILVYKSAEEVENSEQGMRRIGETLPTEKVFVVLDDVHNKEHIKILLGNYPLYPRSRIIITTKEKMQVEGFQGVIQWYDMPPMDNGHALELFCRHAFGTNFPRDDFRGLSSEIVLRMGGLPLAIKVTGSLLKGQEEELWKETLVKLGELLEDEILEVLQISFDDLKGYQQQIFLDIACFLVNEKKTHAIYMWADRGVYPIRAIKVLTERCLIKILEDDKFWMHDQLINLGRHIVYQESLGDLKKQSRLWIAEEALQIIRTKERKDKVHALFVRISEITNEDFEKLPNLRFLKLADGTYAGDYSSCHPNLKWFSWSSPPEKDFGAVNLYMDRLVVCKLYRIDFKDDSKAWDLIKRARDLKVLSITRCYGITTIPDISKCSSLERLTLERCFSLKRIKSSIKNLQSLIELKIEGCSDLTDLPEEIGALVKLKQFSLSGCSSLRELPDSIRNLISLTELDLSGTIIREVSNSIGKLKSLRILRFSIPLFVDWENHDRQFPSSISTLINLEELDLSGHNEMTGEIPVGIGELSSLRILNLKSTSICGIPRTTNVLHHLQTLNLLDCHEIQELPELPTSLTCLHLESESLLSVPNLSNLTNLVELLLSNYKFFGEKSKPLTGCNLRWIGRLSKLKKLELNLLDVPAPPELAFLSHLEELVMSRLELKPLLQLPSSDGSWRNMLTLEIGYCEVEDIPLEGFRQLEKLNVYECPRLQKLFIPLELRKLWQVHVSWCGELVKLQVAGLSTSLGYLHVYECKSLTSISRLSYVRNLKTLRIEKCDVLTVVDGLNELESLKHLRVQRCKLLRRLIDASCTKIQDDCLVKIQECGDFNRNSDFQFGMSMKHYKEEIPVNTSIKVDDESDLSSDEWIRRINVFSDEDWIAYPGSDTDEDPESAYGGESEIDGTSFVDDFQSESGNADCRESTGNRRQTRDYGSVAGAKTAIKDRTKDNDEIREPAKQNDVLQSTCQGCEGVEHYERSWKVATEVEDQRDLSTMEHPFTIRFHLGVKKTSEGFEFVGAIQRENEDVPPDSVTYEGLIAVVEGFGFCLERMWYQTPDEDRELLMEIKSDEKVKEMVELASKSGLIHLYIAGRRKGCAFIFSSVKASCMYFCRCIIESCCKNL